MNTKTAEEMKEIVRKNIPKDCYWEDMDNLTNTPIRYVFLCMEEYASPLKKRIEELEAIVLDAASLLDKNGYAYTAKEMRELLHPSTNGK